MRSTGEWVCSMCSIEGWVKSEDNVVNRRVGGE